MLLIAGTVVALPLLIGHLPDSSATPQGGGQGVPFSLSRLFLFFVKVGSVLYGGGYVLLAFLRDGLVTRWHWLTSAQLLDATAVGPSDARPVVYDSYFHRIPDGRRSRSGSGNGRDFSAVIRLCGD